MKSSSSFSCPFTRRLVKTCPRRPARRCKRGVPPRECNAYGPLRLISQKREPQRVFAGSRSYRIKPSDYSSLAVVLALQGRHTQGQYVFAPPSHRLIRRRLAHKRGIENVSDVRDCVDDASHLLACGIATSAAPQQLSVKVQRTPPARQRLTTKGPPILGLPLRLSFRPIATFHQALRAFPVIVESLRPVCTGRDLRGRAKSKRTCDSSRCVAEPRGAHCQRVTTGPRLSWTEEALCSPE